ncbi:hypothetical protein D8674_026373 [Pyrus ussuriensis x Pyrus communis]|uniref:Integrase catalytic domain-containing protein n=1 Tax=Pyrus ussuriensis x Pyrus communis TaxID=2448454 RepID=A0A5N5I7X6_9ROSA|nr:hypothetical protein D8674_026373 [Pyrus ussuriensis x Pyrus communis]
MPRHTLTTRLTIIDARLTAIEAILADLPNLLRNSIAVANVDLSAMISTDFDAKLAFSFEQFRREQSFVGGVGSSNPVFFAVDPIPPPVLVTYDADFRLLETHRHPHHDQFEPGGEPQKVNPCFLGGLKRELVYDVKLLRLTSVHVTISIVIQVVAKLSALRSHNLRYLLATKVTPLPIMLPRPKTTNLPYRKLTLEEVQRKKDRGECCFCPEKWVMGYKCTHKQLLLLDMCDDGELCEENDEAVQAELQGMALSECAFYGMNAKRFLQTMNVLGNVKGQPVRILLDSGCKIKSQGYCRHIPLELGRYHCHTDLFALPLGGCDLVLGVQWLSTVSHVLWDFQLLTMEFQVGQNKFKLSHSIPPQLVIQEMSLQQLNKELYDSNLGVLLYSLESTPEDTSIIILMRFDAVFQIPSQLPPHRARDHKIPLLQGSKPQSIGLYHYAPAQKDEIEKVVQELLVTVHSHSLCCCQSWEEHLVHLEKTLELLQQHQLFVKKQKCSFGQHQVEYLGHIVSSEGVSADPAKIQAILEWLAPKNVKELRGFLGLTCSFPEIDASHDFTPICDAYGLGIRAVLRQHGRPIAFASQALGPRNQALSTYERGLIVIIYTVKKWQNYLQGRHFIIKTEHNSLKYFLSQRTNTLFQQKWVSKLLGLDYEVQYRHGKENIVADALSQVPRSPPLSELPLKEKGELLAVTYPYFGWRRKVFKEHHSTPAAGHEGVLKTYQILKRGKSVILVAVDRLSKYRHFIALRHPYTASMVAQEFVENIFKLHDMPLTIVSDRDPIFLSVFWREFFKLQGLKLCMSLGYHPQSDRQTEVLQHFISHCLQFTPFEIVYGYLPPHIVSYELGSAKMESVEQGLMARDKMLTMLKTNLIITQNRIKVQANKNRSEKTFEVGDWVYLKLILYQLQSLATHAYHKLHPKFYGPFKVLKKVGSVAYKLKLPETSKLHPVFHVSCLKKHVGPDVNLMPLLPLVTDDGLQAQEPVAMLQRRVYKKNNADKNSEESTWEDYDEFTTKFPGFKF